MQSSILYQSTDRGVTLIDIPTSISRAQGTQTHPWTRQLISTQPLEAPFPQNEPKSDKARANICGNPPQDNDLLYMRLVEEALTLLKQSYHGEWCLPRCVAVQDATSPRKRKAEERGELRGLKDSSARTILPSTFLAGLATAKYSTVDGSRGTMDIEKLSCTEEQYQQWRPTICNRVDSPMHIQILSAQPERHSFHVPARSSFFLGNCSESTDFHVAIRNAAQEQDSPRKFDFVLMDPPWPNASVKRSRKTSTSSYQTSTTLWDIQELILGMDVDVLFGDGALIGVWITNKPAVRELVLGDGGFFETWGVELEEEWVWIKTTKHGHPVTSLDALWRKPYEILLLGRRRGRLAGRVHEHDRDVSGPKRRTIIGVPDLHSRKPCLKELIEPLMPDPKQYRALEIFARHLVAEWWSWGNEVLKFSHESCWTR